MQRMRDQGGFSLIELLVVILIVGILASIAIPSFLSQRTRAADQVPKATVTTALKAARAYRVEERSYENVDEAKLEAIESSLIGKVWSVNPSASLTGTANAAVIILADSTQGAAGGGTFAAFSEDGATHRVCTQPGKGGCSNKRSPLTPSYGTW